MPVDGAADGRARRGTVVNTGSDLVKQPEPAFIDYGVQSRDVVSHFITGAGVDIGGTIRGLI